MKIAIVDDNASDRQALAQLLLRYAQLRSLTFDLALFSDGNTLLDDPKLGLYQIYFLDICMEGLDGLTLAARLREAGSQGLVLFTTTSTEYAVDSYRVRAFHYLLKPLTEQAVFDAMALCEKALTRSNRHIEIKCGRVVIRVPVKDIIYTDYSNHFVYLYTKIPTAAPLRTSMGFEPFSHLVADYPQFLNCYRNTLINMDEVSRMEQSDFLMSNGITVPMWRNKKSQLRQNYMEYLLSRGSNK